MHNAVRVVKDVAPDNVNEVDRLLSDVYGANGDVDND